MRILRVYGKTIWLLAKQASLEALVSHQLSGRHKLLHLEKNYIVGEKQLGLIKTSLLELMPLHQHIKRKMYG